MLKIDIYHVCNAEDDQTALVGHFDVETEEMLTGQAFAALGPIFADWLSHPCHACGKPMEKFYIDFAEA